MRENSTKAGQAPVSKNPGGNKEPMHVGDTATALPGTAAPVPNPAVNHHGRSCRGCVATAPVQSRRVSRASREVRKGGALAPLVELHHEEITVKARLVHIRFLGEEFLV